MASLAMATINAEEARKAKEEAKEMQAIART
jgi:hypothetical protein